VVAGLVALAAWTAACNRAAAQQNLFNVPSAEITRPNEIFYQQQFNVNESTETNLSLAYGVGKEFEIGLNVFNLVMIPESNPTFNEDGELFLANVQKGIYFNDWFKIGVGSQLGETIANRREDVRFAEFTWLTGVLTLWDDQSRVYGGFYDANKAFRGDCGDELGFMLGYDIPTAIEKIDLVGDYISGSSDISVAVLGAVWDMTENWQFSLGGQLPSPHSGNSYGAVVELTLIPHRGRQTLAGGSPLLGAAAPGTGEGK
jgi:hypothetical protein